MSTHNILWDSSEYQQQAILMSTHNICFYGGDSNEYPQHVFMENYRKLSFIYH